MLKADSVIGGCGTLCSGAAKKVSVGISEITQVVVELREIDTAAEPRGAVRFRRDPASDINRKGT